MIRTALISCLLASSSFAETLVATRVVRPHKTIAVTDYAISEQGVPGALAGTADIAGMEARVTLYPGRPIMPEHVGPAAVIERNAPVTLIFRQGPLVISTGARALSRGAAGDVVKVMNLASRNTVSGRVRADGTVEVAAGKVAR